MRRRRLLLIPAMLVLVTILTSCTERDVAYTDCMENVTRPAIIVAPATGSFPGSATHTVIPHQSPVDLRQRVIDHTNGVNGFKLERDLTGSTRDGVCLVGGYFYTTLDETATWSQYWHNARNGMVIEAPNTKVIGPTIRNTGDGISINALAAHDWAIVGLRADGMPGVEGLDDGAYIHDDCVENDVMQSGTISDSKFDGCHSFLSAQVDQDGIESYDGSENTVEVFKTLVRLQPMYNSYKPLQYGYDQHGGFFKFSRDDEGDLLGDGTPPKLVLKSSIFRVDKDPIYGTQHVNGPLGLPPGTVCDNVVVVGWDYLNGTEQASWIEACGPLEGNVDENGFPNLHEGTIAEWDAAVALWDEEHPAL